MPLHLNEEDFDKFFPDALDEFPTPINEEHYIDAWLFNSLFNSLLATEEYLIEYKDNIEAPIGEDVLGIEGELEIAIPPARYPAYKFAMAWDPNLLEENIKAGEEIFGVTGTLAAGAGGVGVSAPLTYPVPFSFGATVALNNSITGVSVPSPNVV